MHIGPPKTGTTTLQGAFHGERTAISAQGVHYAGPTRQPMGAVLAVMGHPNPTSGEVPPIGKWDALVREMRDAGRQRVVLSSERLAYAGPAAIRRIVDDLGPSDVQVVVTLRPLARILPSQWQQSAQAGVLDSFEAFLEQIFDDPDGRQGSKFWYRHRHDRLVDRWANVVGRERLTVVALDEQDHGMILRAFEAMLGLRDGTLVADGDRTNRSMTLGEVEMVRAFNERFFAEGLARSLHTRVMRHGAATYIKTREPGADEPRITMPRWALDRAAAISDAMIDGIVASAVRIVGDPDGLRSVTTSSTGDDRPSAVRVAPEIAANAAVGVLLSSGIMRRSRDGEREMAPSAAEPIALARIPTGQVAAILMRRVRAAGRTRAQAWLRRAG